MASENEPLLRRRGGTNVNNDDTEHGHKGTTHATTSIRAFRVWMRRLCAGSVCLLMFELLRYFVVSAFIEGWIEGFATSASDALAPHLAPKNPEFREKLTNHFQSVLALYTAFVVDVCVFFLLGVYADYNIKRVCGVKVVASGAFADWRLLLRSVVKCTFVYMLYWVLSYPKYLEYVLDIDTAVLDVWVAISVIWLIDHMFCVFLVMVGAQKRPLDLLLGTRVIPSEKQPPHTAHEWVCSLRLFRMLLITLLLLVVGTPIVTVQSFNQLNSK